MTKSSSEISELITGCQGLVRSIAWKIHQRLPKSVDLDDLIGYGQVGLAEAARDFDLQRGVQFTTYAYYRVRGSILDGLSRMDWFTKADYARGSYESSANDIMEGSRQEEVGDDSKWFHQTTHALSMSYIMTHWADSGVAEPSNTITPCDNAETEDLRQKIRSMLDDLTPQEQTLMRGIYFDGLTVKAAGEKIGITKGWASRLHARTLESLAIQLCDNHDQPSTSQPRPAKQNQQMAVPAGTSLRQLK
ncbi:MAG: sigma-70 family RNA polymerase sigma factor [Fuerstiella sp.]